MRDPVAICRLLCHTAALRLWEVQGAGLVSFLPAAATAHEDPEALRVLWDDLGDTIWAAIQHHEQNCPTCQFATIPPLPCPLDARLDRLSEMSERFGWLGFPPYYSMPREVRLAAIDAQAAGTTGMDAVGVALTLVANLDPVTDDASRDAVLALIVEAWAVAQLI